MPSGTDSKPNKGHNGDDENLSTDKGTAQDVKLAEGDSGEPPQEGPRASPFSNKERIWGGWTEATNVLQNVRVALERYDKEPVAALKEALGLLNTYASQVQKPPKDREFEGLYVFLDFKKPLKATSAERLADELKHKTSTKIEAPPELLQQIHGSLRVPDNDGCPFYKSLHPGKLTLVFLSDCVHLALERSLQVHEAVKLALDCVEFSRKFWTAEGSVPDMRLKTLIEARGRRAESSSENGPTPADEPSSSNMPKFDQKREIVHLSFGLHVAYMRHMEMLDEMLVSVGKRAEMDGIHLSGHAEAYTPLCNDEAIEELKKSNDLEASVRKVVDGIYADSARRHSTEARKVLMPTAEGACLLSPLTEYLENEVFTRHDHN